LCRRFEERVFFSECVPDSKAGQAAAIKCFKSGLSAAQLLEMAQKAHDEETSKKIAVPEERNDDCSTVRK
jgi:hypothetical protein